MGSTGFCVAPCMGGQNVEAPEEISKITNDNNGSPSGTKGGKCHAVVRSLFFRGPQLAKQGFESFDRSQG